MSWAGFLEVLFAQILVRLDMWGRLGIRGLAYVVYASKSASL